MLVELPPTVTVLRFGLFALDLRRRELRREGRPVRLAKLPFDALRLLAAQPQMALTRVELIAALWPGQLADRNENLDTLMRQVRAALGDTAQNPRFLQTVRGVGFCFLAEVTRVVEEVPTPAATAAPVPEPPAWAPVAPKASWGRRAWGGGVAAILVLVAAVGWIAAAPGAPPLPIRSGWTEITSDGLQKAGDIFVRGDWIYFTEVRDGEFQVVRVPVGGGMTWPVAGAGRDTLLLAASPQADHLLVESPVADDPAHSDVPLWLLDKNGARRFGEFAAHAAAFSPDGTTLMLARGSALYLADVNGFRPRLLRALPAEPIALAWSPDSARICFVEVGNPNRAPTEWEMGRDGKHLRTLGAVGDGHSNVAQAWRSDVRGSVLVLANNDSTMKAWELPATEGWGRAFSPRSLELGLAARLPGVAFDTGMRHVYRMGSVFGGTLVRYDATGRQFLPMAPGVSIDYVDYAPRGGAVAYDSALDGPIWRAAADFSDAKRLTPPEMRTETPRWSPDGRWIAFMAETAGQPWDLDMVPAAGGAVQVLARGTPRAGMGAPTWSPDGGTLYFGHVNCADPATCGVERLDLRSRTLSTVPGSEGLRTARLSPDGRTLAALSSSHEMEVFDLRGDPRTGTWRPLAAVGVEDILAWSHDSQYLYAFAAAGGPPRIFRFRLRDGAVQPVASLPSEQPSGDIVSQWFGLDPHDGLIVYQSSQSDEIFAARLGTP